LSNVSSIEWTDSTWNVVTGCTQVSPGCDHCYAMTFAERWRGVKGNYFESGFDLMLRPNMLDRPALWKAPRRVFVNSMSDLFHKGVPDAYLDSVFDRMESVDRHVYQILTKRPERMRRYLKKRYGAEPIPAHIWLGVSVESNAFAWRVDMLREVNVPVRFLSIEPMLGPVNRVSFRGIHWVIVGGESGHGYRPMREAWVNSVRDRCVRRNIAFFFKQWHKNGTGRLLGDRTWDQMPFLVPDGVAKPPRNDSLKSTKGSSS